MTVRSRRHALGVALTVLLTAVPVTAGVMSFPHTAASASDSPSAASSTTSEPAAGFRILSAAAPAGAPMVSAEAARHAAVTCFGDLADQTRPPVLLVPGTGLNAEENWAPTYRPALLAHGFPVCQVDLPAFATRDVQVSAEYVATAIRDVRRTAGRTISVLGLSQGALLPRAALKIWPSLKDEVDDVVGLAGIYDAGSAGVDERCRESCVPALQQLRRRSALLTALAERPLPPGPSYTNVGTMSDLTVTPQPSANVQPRSHAIYVQDVCPSRAEDTNAHAYLAGDAVAFALVLDTLVAKGTGSPDRIPAEVCDEHFYPEFDEQTWTDLAPVIGSRLTAKVTREPAVRCYLDPHCADVDARGRVLSLSTQTVRGRTMTWTGRARETGFVRLRMAGRTVQRPVVAGRQVVLTMTAPRTSKVLSVETAPTGYRAWGVEKQHRVAGRR